MHTSVSHSTGMNRAIANILALATKLGIGSSTPTANTVLRGTGSGTSAFGQIVSGDITDGTLVNADVNASAGILLSKLEGGTSGLLKSNGTVITSGNTIGSADIADDSITNADVNSAAAIAVTKLAHVGANNVLRSNGTANVGGQVVNADVAAAAALAVSKLSAGGTASRVVGTIDGSTMQMTQVNGSMIPAATIGNSHVSAADPLYGDNKLIASSVTGNASTSAIGTNVLHANRMTAGSFIESEVTRVFGAASIPDSRLVRQPALIQEITLGAAAGSVTFSSIPQTYAHLLLVASTRQDDAATGMAGLALRFNGDASAIYAYQVVLAAGSAQSTFGAMAQTEAYVGGSGGGGSPGANFVINDLLIANYSYNGIHKQCRGIVSGAEGAPPSGSSMKMFITGGVWQSGSPITSLTCLPQGGNFIVSCRFSLYGIPA